MRNRLIYLICLMALLLAGCSAEEAEAPVQEEPVAENVINIQNNDYNGSVERILGIEESVMNLIDGYIGKMEAVKEENPDDYWNSDDYTFFSFNGFSKELINHYGWLNERQPFEDASASVRNTFLDSEGQFPAGMGGYSLTRDAMNHYTCVYSREGSFPVIGNILACFDTEVIYDANHDWSTVYERYAGYYNQDTRILDKMFEYARLDRLGTDNRFAIQTETERAYAVYDSEGKLKTLYYSQLDGENRDKVYPLYTETQEIVEEYGTFRWVTTKTENTYPSTITSIYNEEDSLFKNVDSIDGNWVIGDANIRNVIIYEDEALTIRQYNYLSGKMEESVIDRDGQVTKTTYVISGDTGYSRQKGTLYVTVSEGI